MTWTRPCTYIGLNVDFTGVVSTNSTMNPVAGLWFHRVKMKTEFKVKRTLY